MKTDIKVKRDGQVIVSHTQRIDDIAEFNRRVANDKRGSRCGNSLLIGRIPRTLLWNYIRQKVGNLELSVLEDEKFLKEFIKTHNDVALATHKKF